MGRAKVISFVKDPHIVFIDSSTPRPTEFCPCRVMVEDGEGYIYVRSLAESDIEGDLTAEDIINLDYKECWEVNYGVIMDSIKAWREPGRSDPCESELDTALYVLSQFKKANMLTEDLDRRIFEDIEV